MTFEDGIRSISKLCNPYRRQIKPIIKPKKLTETQRYKNRIRHMTWKKYGFATKCSRCTATSNETYIEHHHYTDPYEFDKFIDVCFVCHIKIHMNKNLTPLVVTPSFS